MHDHIKTKRYYGEIKPGTLLRATGNGQQLLRVRSVNPDGTGTVETYGQLRYGRLYFPIRNFYIRPCKVYQPGRVSDWGTVLESGVSVETGRYNRYWSYTPVELESRFYDPLDAFEMGRAYAEGQTKKYTQSHIGVWSSELGKTKRITIEEYIRDAAHWANPFKGHSIEQAWADGVNNYMDNQQAIA